MNDPGTRGPGSFRVLSHPGFKLDLPLRKKAPMGFPFRQPADVPENVLEGPWKIMSLDAANWAAQKYAEAMEEIRVAEAARDRWVDQVAEWFDAETASAKRTVEKMGDLLGEWAIERREETDRKSQKLVGAVVETRSSSARVVIADKDAVLAWAGRRLESLDTVAPRKVSLAGVQAVVAPIEVPTRVLLSCGDTAGGDAFTENADALAIGKGAACPVCGEFALVARWTETTWLAVSKDQPDEPVPGVEVTPPGVTAKVVIDRPAATDRIDVLGDDGTVRASWTVPA